MAYKINTKSAAKKIIQISFGFVLYLLIINLICYLYIKQISNLIGVQSLIPEYNFRAEFWANVIFGFAGSLVFACVEVLFLSAKFKGKPYLFSILFKGFLHILIILFFLTGGSFFYHSMDLRSLPFEDEVIGNVSNFMIGYGGLKKPHHDLDWIPPLFDHFTIQ